MTDRAKPQFDYFPLFFWDLERDTEHMTDSEKMGYIRVLAHLYKNGGTMDDDLEAVKKLARFTGKRNSGNMTQAVYNMLIPCLLFPDGTVLTDIETSSSADNGLSGDKRGAKQLTQKRVLETIKKIKHIQKVNHERAVKAAEKRWGAKRQK